MKTSSFNFYIIKAYFFLTLAALFWSGNFNSKVISTYEVPPFSLNFTDGCLLY